MIPNYLKGTILVFDTETAVLGDHIVEIGFSLFKDAKPIQEWGTFIKPSVPIDPEASAVHKITDADVEDFPVFAEVAWWIWNILNIYDVHCAYNYDYDRGVLVKEFKRLGMEFPLKPMIDPMILFKKWNKYNRGKKLTDAAEKYGIPLIGAHRAMNDSTACGNLLIKMAATRTTFPKTLQKFIELQRQWIEEQFLDYAAYRKSKGQEPPTPPVFAHYEVAV